MPRRHLLLLVLVFGCAKPPTPAATAPVLSNAKPPVLPGTRVATACPDTLENERWAWNRELFPGCAPKPFSGGGTTCDGECPRPCRAIYVEPGRSGPYAASFEYDANGRWASSTESWRLGEYMGERRSAPTPPDGDRYCTRTGDHEGTCDIINLGSDRIQKTILRYDDAGDLVSLQDASNPAREVGFEYVDHRLVTERPREPGAGTIEYSYDARGRLAKAITSGWSQQSSTTYTYDDADHLITKVMESDTERFTTTFEYDRRGRPMHRLLIMDSRGVDPTRMEQTYFYDCPAPRSFDEAVAKMSAFQAEACACTDAACKAKVGGEIDRWRTGLSDLTSYRDGSDDQYTRFGELARAARTCLGG